MNWMPLFPLDQERARRYKGLGSTATAFVSTREQQQDPESWHVEPWVIGSAMMVEPVSLSIFIGNNLFYIIYIYIYDLETGIWGPQKHFVQGHSQWCDEAVSRYRRIPKNDQNLVFSQKVSPVAWRGLSIHCGKKAVTVAPGPLDVIQVSSSDYHHFIIVGKTTHTIVVVIIIIVIITIIIITITPSLHILQIHRHHHHHRHHRHHHLKKFPLNEGFKVN